MPLITNNPVPDPDGDYGYLSMNLAISPLWSTNNIGASVALKLVPYRVNPDGTIQASPENERLQVYADAFTAALTDPALATAIDQIMAAMQQYIYAENL